MQCDLELNGWRQGSMVRARDISGVLSDVVTAVPHGAELIVVSQSCDLAQPVEVEPEVEAFIAAPIEKVDGNLTHNKNARLLDLTVKVATGIRSVTRDIHVRVSAKDKIMIPKARFLDRTPSERKQLPIATQTTLAEWCAARYSRPAFPSAFNDALAAADRSNKKRKKIAKHVSAHTSGIYVKVAPNRDLRAGEKYHVNLLGILVPSAEKHRNAVSEHVEALKDLMEAAGMEVEAAVQSEREVSLSTIKAFRRFYYDDISYRNDHPLPVELDSHKFRA